MTAAQVDRLRKDARALVDAITDDESGSMVAGHWVGGHGGLLSRNTLARAEELRRTLCEFERVPV